MAQNTVSVPRLSMLSREQCEAVHRASLEILRRTGVRVYHQEGGTGAIAPDRCRDH
jgi:trimethylamine:corrinoid methyltransferase-like protein